MRQTLWSPGVRRAIAGSLSSYRFHIDIQRLPPFRFLGTESRSVPAQPISGVQAHPTPAIGRLAQLPTIVNCERGREPVPLGHRCLEWIEAQLLPSRDVRGVEAERFPVLRARAWDLSDGQPAASHRVRASPSNSCSRWRVGGPTWSTVWYPVPGQGVTARKLHVDTAKPTIVMVRSVASSQLGGASR